MSRVNNVTTSRSKLVIGRAPKSHAKDVAAPFWESNQTGGGRHFPCLCFSAWPHTVTWMDDKGGPTPPILISLCYYGRTGPLPARAKRQRIAFYLQFKALALSLSLFMTQDTNLIEARGRIDCRSRMLQVGLDVGERVQLDGRPHPVQRLNKKCQELLN